MKIWNLYEVEYATKERRGVVRVYARDPKGARREIAKACPDVRYWVATQKPGGIDNPDEDGGIGAAYTVRTTLGDLLTLVPGYNKVIVVDHDGEEIAGCPRWRGILTGIPEELYGLNVIGVNPEEALHLKITVDTWEDIGA